MQCQTLEEFGENVREKGIRPYSVGILLFWQTPQDVCTKYNPRDLLNLQYLELLELLSDDKLFRQLMMLKWKKKDTNQTC